MLFRRPGKEPLSGGHITPFAQRLQRFSNSGTYRCTHRKMVVWAKAMPRSAIIWDEIAGAELKRQIPPHAQDDDFLIDGAIEVDPLATNLNISLVYAPGIADRPRITRHRAFQQFAPEPSTECDGSQDFSNTRLPR